MLRTGPAVVLLGLLLTLAGCSSSGEDPEALEERAQNDEQPATLEERAQNDEGLAALEERVQDLEELAALEERVRALEEAFQEVADAALAALELSEALAAGPSEEGALGEQDTTSPAGEDEELLSGPQAYFRKMGEFPVEDPDATMDDLRAELPELRAFTVGSDPHLDDLWSRCEHSDRHACQDLYLSVPFCTGYEALVLDELQWEDTYCPS